MVRKLFILIPVFNEAANLPRLIHSLQNLCVDLQNQYVTHVLLIDDGSQDNTSELATLAAKEKNLNLIAIKHHTNQGPGKAFATGFSHLAPLLGDNDLVLTMEGDNTSRLELIRQMLLRMNEGFDAIFASPYIYGGQILNTSTFRVILSNIANLLIKELLGINGILTVSSFFRLYLATSLKRLQAVYGSAIVERNGFECMVELTMKMVNLKITISEVPLILDSSLRVGKSRMKIMRTILGYLTLWPSKTTWKLLAEKKHQ